MNVSINIKKATPILAVIGVVTTLGFFLFKGYFFQSGTNHARQEAAQDQSGIASPTQTNLPEISFNKTLFIQHETYSVDGGKEQKIPCPPEGIQFATIKLNQNESGILFCFNDYLGGVSLNFKDQKNADKRFDLAQSDGDAGDVWDFRSIILKNPDGTIRIERLSFATTRDLEKTDSPVECKSKRKAFLWDAGAKMFVDSEFLGAITEKMFDPPSELLDSCRGPNGLWKDSSPNQL